MAASPPDGPKERSFSYYLMLWTFFIVVLIVCGITFVDYTIAKRNLEEQYQFLKNQTESTVIQEIQIADDGLKLFDTTLNHEMRDIFTLFFDEYNRSGKNPAQMDLESIKTQTGGLVDLYIINSSGVIEYTTFLPDRYLDFRNIPYFYSYLESIRISDGFFPDRIVIEPATGVLRKYAYMPTPDHGSIFELGLTGSALENTRGSLKYHERIHVLTSLNPYVKDFRIFTSRKQQEDNRSFIPDPEFDAILTTIISERKGLEREILDAGERVSYLFVDLRDELYGSDVSRIVEITYDESVKQAALNNLLLIHIITAIAALAIMSGIAILLALRIKEPIQEMAVGADIISKGSLDHMISIDHEKQSHFFLNPHSLARKLRFSNYILVYMVLIIGLTVVGLTVVDVMNADTTFRKNALTMQFQTEESLNQTIHLVDEGYKLFDASLNKEMQTGFEIFMAEYERAGRDVSKMDLDSVKTKLGDLTDLYIINKSLVIEYTTFTPDLGLDFKQYPSTKEYLTKIIKGEGFYPDRVVRETATGQFRKYAYMPTPDHQYILELGILGPGIKQRHGKVGYQEVFESIITRNPYIVRASFFDSTKHVVNNFTYRPDEEEKKALNAAIETRSLVTITQEEEHRIIRYLFIDLLDLDYASDMSWIIKLTYDSERINAALFDLLLLHAYIGLATLMMGVIGAIVVSRHLTRPVQQIVSDLEQIAKGDIDHDISPVRGSEFEVLERSINSMVATLKANITQLRDSEMKLRQSEQKFRDLVRLLPQPVFEIDHDGKILLVNESAYELFGYTAEDLEKGLNVSDVIVPEQHELVRKNMELVIQGSESKGTEYLVRKKDGSRLQVLVYSTPVYQGTEVIGLRGVIIDISDLKRVEKEIRRLNEELEQRVVERTFALQNANRELESFTYSVSHDLRAPLRAIDGFSAILLDDARSNLSEKERQYLNNIRKNTQQMASLIDDLLNFSRTGRLALQREMIKPEELIQAILGEFAEEAKRREIEVVIGNLPPCYADPTMLHQVYFNLLSNAFKFTRQQSHPRIEIGSFTEGGENVFFVRDNGVGFDMRYATKLFGVFQRLHNPQEYEGTGVGLAIVYRIIQRHGGRISAESKEGIGTTFFFTL